MIVADIVFILRMHAPQREPVHALPVAESRVFTEPPEAAPVALPDPEVKPAWRELNVAGPAHEIAEGEKYTVERIEAPAEKPVSDFIRTVPEKIVPQPEPEPVVRREGAPAKIIVIIDDMGMDRKRSKAIAELPGPLTLAYLPYAPDLPKETGAAKARGHELIIHMPMEPMDQSIDPGPIVLRTGMSDAELDAMLAKAFASFDGYVGINNHMGSKLTQDEHAMRHVMAVLKARDLLFVDSKTIASSVASHMAAEAGLKYADRDVFLDNVNSVEAVRKNLHQLERIADRKGYAIAIGHPRDGTIGALREWLPTLKARGFELVPVSSVAHRARARTVAKATVSPVSSAISPAPVPPRVQPPAAQPAPY
jgi:polysaccharide deacetylase 2 family uncharacterized protein YibQ